MRFGKHLMMAAVATLAVAPAVAAPVNPAASLSVSKSLRVGSAAGGKEKLEGTGAIVAVAAAVAVGVGIYLIVDEDGNSDSP